MKKILLILAVLTVLAVVLTAPQAMAKSHYRHHGGIGIFIPVPLPPPVIIIPPPIPYPNYPPPHGYYGGHWETRWEWDPYSQRWYQTRVWVDDYPYYGGHPRRW
jgi:hypothetical protein